jgi:hypothetical protein
MTATHRCLLTCTDIFVGTHILGSPGSALVLKVLQEKNLVIVVEVDLVDDNVSMLAFTPLRHHDRALQGRSQQAPVHLDPEAVTPKST